MFNFILIIYLFIYLPVYVLVYLLFYFIFIYLLVYVLFYFIFYLSVYVDFYLLWRFDENVNEEHERQQTHTGITFTYINAINLENFVSLYRNMMS